MSRWLLVLLIIVVIAVIWYWQRERAREAEQRRADEARRLPGGTAATPRRSLNAAEGAPAPRDGGTFQRAAEAASGAGLEQATAEMQAATAGLAAARREADLAAARLSAEAEATLAAVQAAAAAYGGAVPGDGTPDCPSGYPIKGANTSKIYVDPERSAYAALVPDVCFRNTAAAEAAGFMPAAIDDGSATPEAAFGQALAAADQERGPRSDVVEAAIAAADAGSVPPGAIRGDGGRDCPSAYPIKGNQSSMLYHEPGSPTYESTIPEFCFSSAESAEAAGFAATRF